MKPWLWLTAITIYKFHLSLFNKISSWWIRSQLLLNSLTPISSLLYLDPSACLPSAGWRQRQAPPALRPWCSTAPLPEMRPHYISTLRLYFDVGNSIYYSSWVHLYERSTGDNLGHQGWEPLGRGVLGEGVYEGLELDDPGQGGEGVQAGLSGW